MATIEQIRDAMHRAPFSPLTVRLIDGRSFVVRHPDFIAVSPEPRGRGVLIFDDARVNTIDALMVVSVEYPDPAAMSAGGNGT